MNTLSKFYEKAKSELIEKLSKQKYICTTCDVWSSRSQSFFGMTVHYLNSEYKRESHLLAFRPLPKKQTNVEMVNMIRQIYREFKIDPRKVTHIVTDGGSAFTKAFKLFGKEVDTMVEPCDENIEDDLDNIPLIQSEDGEQYFSNILNLDENDSDDTRLNDFEPNDENDEFLEQNDEFTSAESSEAYETDSEMDENNDLVIDSNADDEFQNLPLPAQRRCLSHLLNLLGNDFEKDLTGKAKTCMIATMNKLQSMWVFPRKSSHAKTMSKEILGCMLQQPCVTRWNSRYDAVKKIQELGIDKINNYIDALKKNLKTAEHLTKLDKEDWIMVNIYMKVMRPIAVTLDKLQGETDCTQGYILPSLFVMKKMLTTLEGGNVLKSCRDTMLHALEKRLGAFFRINVLNKELLLAAVTSPQFKTDFLESDIHCMVVKDMLISEIRYMETEIPENISEANSDEAQEENCFFASFAARREARSHSPEYSAEDEVLKYLQDSRTNYESLNDYPKIRDLFFKHNTTLASSAAVERVFSQSSLIFTPRRNRLLASNFERVLFLKYNSKKMK